MAKPFYDNNDDKNRVKDLYGNEDTFISIANMRPSVRDHGQDQVDDESSAGSDGEMETDKKFKFLSVYVLSKFINECSAHESNICFINEWSLKDDETKENKKIIHS